MTWLARLKDKISETPGGVGVAKGAKRSLAALATASPLSVPEIKSDPKHYQIVPDLNESCEVIQEYLGNRAAIQEYNGELTREHTETESHKNMRVYEYRLTDIPESHLIMIAPDYDLEEAQESLRRRFGDRLLDVRSSQRRGGDHEED